ncbi:MAG: hypothetical protein KIT69_10810, partial [Propionibacteriaceae bacterium]|nr:hypothetical protein [Propionibacteriaceae bacterium]
LVRLRLPRALPVTIVVYLSAALESTIPLVFNVRVGSGTSLGQEHGHRKKHTKENSGGEAY